MECWLVNASPDLRSQIESDSTLQPHFQTSRNSPVRGVLLTNADLDHLLGLFGLREGERLRIYATAAVRRAADEGLGLARVLSSFCGASWDEPPLDFAPLAAQGGRAGPVLFRAIPLVGKPPPFARDSRGEAPDIHSVAYQFLDPATGGRLLVAPDVAAVNAGLQQALEESEAVLFDGTFWSSDELAGVKSGALTADQMGHLPIRDCSLELLRKLPARHKIYLHINNTNPILAPGSAERAAVEAAGIVVGEDGMEFEV